MTEVESFLYPVTVMDVNVKVEHSWIDLKKLQNCEDDVVDVAEAACL